MQNIYFTDIRVEQVTGKGGTSRNPIQINSDLPGAISNIFFTRVSVGNFGPKPSLIGGFDVGSVRLPTGAKLVQAEGFPMLGVVCKIQLPAEITSTN